MKFEAYLGLPCNTISSILSSTYYIVPFTGFPSIWLNGLCFYHAQILPFRNVP